MSVKEKFFRLFLTAALVATSGAALCARAQSRSGKRKSPAAAAKPAPQATTGQPAKRNTRATGGDAAPQTPATNTQSATPPPPQNVSGATKVNSTTNASSSSPSPATQPDPEAPLYTYDFKQPGSSLVRLKIEHDAAGRGRVEFERVSDTELLVEPLQLSPAARARVVALWEALGFLGAGASYQSERQYPHLGTTRLAVKHGGRERVTEFNYTLDRDASALAAEYRRAGEQALLVFEISVALENQPLEMPKLLHRLERMIEGHYLSDPQQLVPLVRDLSTDERVPLIGRNHAERLLKKIEKLKKKDDEGRAESK